LDVGTGKVIWETPRPDATGSFGTPVVWKNEGVEEIVMPGSIRLKGYELATGRERWVVDGMVGFACTTPAIGDGMLFFGGWSPGKADAPWPSWETFLSKNDKNHDGVIAMEEFDPSDRDFARGMDRDHDGKITEADWASIKAMTAKAQNVLVGVKPGGKGDISESHVAWKATRGLPYVPSPLFYEGRIYLVRDGGMVSSLDAQTGNAFYSQERLEAAGSYYSSPVAAKGRIYCASLAGMLSVLKAGGEKPEILHQANFGERIFATPALSGANVYLRTESKLYAFENREKALARADR
jgi:outer membrane protein assembly factor BamB